MTSSLRGPGESREPKQSQDGLLRLRPRNDAVNSLLAKTLQELFVHKFTKSIIIIFSLLCSTLLFAQTSKPLTARKDVQQFINHMVKKHHFDKKQLTTWLNAAHIQPDILKSIAKPAEKLPWYRYEPIFITPKRISEGVDFYQQNYKALKRAEKEYGVPAQIIAAIIGVETFYGKHKGKNSVLDALVTLGFDYPPRKEFFISELEHFLLLAREEHWDPTQIKGSYAGAMGTPQFMPSSYRKFAVDFNGHGKRDLINNTNDAIGSVANYFKASGWKPYQPIAIYTQIKSDKFKAHLASKANPKPNLTYTQLKELGIHLPNNLTGHQFALMEFEGEKKPEYWLGAHNFYVITRYNHSDRYAMAVFTLSKEIKAGYEARTKSVG